MTNHEWVSNSPPPNEEWVDVLSEDGVIIRAMAFYGRDGWRPHWRTEDGTSYSCDTFNIWRKSATENDKVETDQQ